MTKFEEHIAASLARGPSQVMLESSSRCNANCVMCPRDKFTRHQGEMAWDIFRKAWDDVVAAGWKAPWVNLHVGGEPLLLSADDLCRRIDYIKQARPESHICFSTNAALLTVEVTEKLLHSALTDIVFSVDGGDKASYEAIRRGLVWETVVANIKHFVERRNVLQSPVKTMTVIVPQKRNQETLPAYYRVFQEIGVDTVGGSGVNNFGGLVDVADKITSLQRAQPTNPRSPCYRVWQDYCVLSDGTVGLCCMDVTGAVIVGDTKKQTALEIWNGEVWANIRRRHARMAQAGMPLCGVCDYMTYQKPEDWWPH